MRNKEIQLTGNTLRVYIYILKNKQAGVREVQKALGLSNSSLAQYHINKLKELGLVQERNGTYEIVDTVKVSVMKDFLRLGSLIVPRFVFYSVFFSVFAVYFLFFYFAYLLSTPTFLVMGLLILAASFIFWYETIRAWRTVL